MIYKAIVSACLVLLATGCGIAGETDDRAEADNVGSVAEGLIGRYNLSGGWKLRNYTISIQQIGDILKIIIVGWGQVEAQFIDPVTIVTPHGKGTVTNGGQVIRWTNGDIWIRD